MKYAEVKEQFTALQAYVEGQNYAGWDPYDGLNSKLFQATPLRHSRLARLAWIQLFKRNPINLRVITGVPKGHNPKGLALFLSAYVHQQRRSPDAKRQIKINALVKHILEIQTPGYSGACWGYNFDWQAKAFFQPRRTPTVVATSYVANALLDTFELTGNPELLRIARSSCDFVLKDLNRTSDAHGDFCFSYSPLDQTQIYNASLLGSRLLLRLFTHTHEEHLKTTALQSVRYCCRAQRSDGAWTYGTLPFHQWIDNFHSGFNLECLHDIMAYSGDYSFSEALEKGKKFYFGNFFTELGECKFYNDRLYPIDIHAPAQLAIVVHKLGLQQEKGELAKRVMDWTLRNMYDPRGFFYYQIKKGMNSRIPYMRWAQAWMYYGLTLYLTMFAHEGNQEDQVI